MIVRDLQAARPEGVSHNPEILKQVLLRNGEVPHVTTLARAVFEPGQVCTPHVHDTMVEIYMVDTGAGEIEIDGSVVPLRAGACVVVEAGEMHSVRNPGKEPLVVRYFGISTE